MDSLLFPLLMVAIIAIVVYQVAYAPKKTKKRSSTRRLAKREFVAQVHGILRKNADGTSRQKIIGQCYPGEELQLIPEPENRYDPCAIRICRKNGDQLGYWSGGDVRMCDDLASGKQFRVTVDKLYEFEDGNGREKQNVQLLVEVL